MKAEEIAAMLDRINKFRALEVKRDELRLALNSMEHPKVCTSGPFTGNTRETRRIESIRFEFSETLGGSEAVGMKLDNLGIEACVFGPFLERVIREKLNRIKEEMDAI